MIIVINLYRIIITLIEHSDSISFCPISYRLKNAV